MARTDKFKTQRISVKILDALAVQMEKEHRVGYVNHFVEEILLKYCNGILKDWNIEGPRLELALREKLGMSKKVHGVGPVKGIIEEDEGKRKVS